MRCLVLVPLLFAFLTCSDVAPKARRSVKLVPLVTEPIDWTQSAGVFIGIETFLAPAGAPADVAYAADDAADLAWLFAKELPSLLPPDRTRLMLSGRPHKRTSQEHLLLLQREGSVVAENVDAESIYTHIRESAAKVGRDGVLILSIATHGFTAAGAHVLLTPDATTAAPKGVLLNRMLEAIPPGHGRRVLLFVDACRKPLAPAPARLFEELQFPGDYAIFAASGPGGYARADGTARNGFFTRAVLDGLRGRATPDGDGYITPNALDVYVSRQVRDATLGEQRPEARFGGLASLPLFRHDDPVSVASIVAPRQDAAVKPQDLVEVRVDASGLYVTVLVCAASNGQCWKQNSRPIRAAANGLTRVSVQYGATDVFQVHVALTADDAFLHGETLFPSVPHDRRASRIVHWLEPVTVKRQEES